MITKRQKKRPEVIGVHQEISGGRIPGRKCVRKKLGGRSGSHRQADDGKNAKKGKLEPMQNTRGRIGGRGAKKNSKEERERG